MKQTTEIVYWVSTATGETPERGSNGYARRIENGSHYERDTAFVEDASRIRKNPDIVESKLVSPSTCAPGDHVEV